MSDRQEAMLEASRNMKIRRSSSKGMKYSASFRKSAVVPRLVIIFKEARTWYGSVVKTGSYTDRSRSRELASVFPLVLIIIHEGERNHVCDSYLSAIK